MAIPLPQPAVLIIDDDPDIRESMAILLELRGYQALTASDGEAALAQLHDGATPCLILLDLMMPTMNGWQFLDALEHDPDVSGLPVLVLTGGKVPERIPAHVRGCLRKPIDLDALFHHLDHCCAPAAANG